MNAKILILLGVATLAAADSRESYRYAAPSSSSEESFESYESSEAEYNFQYAVRDDSSGNDFGHQEARDDDNTQGSYYVQLPDGRLQTVTYYVDGGSGYVADVQYKGEARYPDSYESFESRSAESFEVRRYDSGSAESFEVPRFVYRGSNESPEAPRYFYYSNESK